LSEDKNDKWRRKEYEKRIQELAEQILNGPAYFTAEKLQQYIDEGLINTATLRKLLERRGYSPSLKEPEQLTLWKDQKLPEETENWHNEKPIEKNGLIIKFRWRIR